MERPFHVQATADWLLYAWWRANIVLWPFLKPCWSIDMATGIIRVLAWFEYMFGIWKVCNDRFRSTVVPRCFNMIGTIASGTIAFDNKSLCHFTGRELYRLYVSCIYGVSFTDLEYFDPNGGCSSSSLLSFMVCYRFPFLYPLVQFPELFWRIASRRSASKVTSHGKFDINFGILPDGTKRPFAFFIILRNVAIYLYNKRLLVSDPLKNYM